jgi:hypothetical protein
MKIERIQSPSIGGSIPVLRRTDGQESDNGKFVGAAYSDPHKKRGGRYYPPKEQREEREDSAARKESSEPSVLAGEERIPLLDITV